MNVKPNIGYIHSVKEFVLLKKNKNKLQITTLFIDKINFLKYVLHFVQMNIKQQYSLHIVRWKPCYNA